MKKKNPMGHVVPLAPQASNEDMVSFEFDTETALKKERRLLLRTLKRRMISADALMSAEGVVDCLGGRSAVVRRWLKENVPLFPHPADRRVYLWGEVLEALRRAA